MLFQLGPWCWSPPQRREAVRKDENRRSHLLLAVARLAGVEIPKHEDTEQTFAELKARIAKTMAFIRTVKPKQIDGTEEKEIVLKIGGHEIKSLAWRLSRFMLQS